MRVIMDVYVLIKKHHCNSFKESNVLGVYSNKIAIWNKIEQEYYNIVNTTISIYRSINVYISEFGIEIVLIDGYNHTHNIHYYISKKPLIS